MLQKINYKHVFYFWVVAKQESIMKAATVLNISASSISEQVKTLEYQLGVQLFLRSKKGVMLTEYGKRIFKTLDQFFPKMEELFESLVNHKSTDVRFLNIGLAPTLSSRVRSAFTYPFIEDIHYTVKIHRGENSYLINAFEMRDIDMILTANRNLNFNIAVERRVLAQKKIVFVMRKGMEKKLHKIEDMSGQKFINYTSDSDLHFSLVDYLNSKNIRPIRIAEIDDMMLVKTVLLSMDCFAALPYKIVEKEVQSQKLVVLESLPEKIQPELSVFYRKGLTSARFEKLMGESIEDLQRLFLEF